MIDNGFFSSASRCIFVVAISRGGNGVVTHIRLVISLILSILIDFSWNWGRCWAENLVDVCHCHRHYNADTGSIYEWKITEISNQGAWLVEFLIHIEYISLRLVTAKSSINYLMFIYGLTKTIQSVFNTFEHNLSTVWILNAITSIQSIQS